MSFLKKIIKILDRLLLYISLTMLTLMVVIVIMQVVSRQIFNYTPSWSEELSRLLFVWVGFWGIAYGIKENLHIGVTFIVDKLPQKIQIIFDYLMIILFIIFGFVLIYYGGQFTSLMSNSKMSGLQISSSYLYVILPLSGIYILLYGFELLFTKGRGQTNNERSDT